ncbi:MAG: hypothetical protein KTR27_05030 [Leptolyngbyaceae cyanobacterium MAG.088]|nr:hypothetical protein [Leptolyngbyaceae cyanobacterium MAG.088]
MIFTLFTQFRQQYANGSLTTELLTTHAEQYLVKATVATGEQVIATALAADKELTVADDQAKTRVLAMLGFSVTTLAQPTTQTMPPSAPSLAPATTTNGLGSASKAEPENSPPTSATLPQATLPQATLPQASEPEDEPELSAPVLPEDNFTDSEDIGRPIDSFTPDEAPAPAQVPASSLAAPILENFDDSNPMDLSDIIAQTDVEMARLGWSSEQGRTYLETTFNKRSRQQLSDEELLTFLLYLESQATPTMG